MTEMTITQPRAWDVPAQPEGVARVRAADGKVWRITDCPGVDPRTNRWVQVESETERPDDPYQLSWRGLVRTEGPLTEVNA
jgi:hypothetical protein